MYHQGWILNDAEIRPNRFGRGKVIQLASKLECQTQQPSKEVSIYRNVEPFFYGQKRESKCYSKQALRVENFSDEHEAFDILSSCSQNAACHKSISMQLHCLIPSLRPRHHHVQERFAQIHWLMLDTRMLAGSTCRSTRPIIWMVPSSCHLARSPAYMPCT